MLSHARKMLPRSFCSTLASTLHIAYWHWQWQVSTNPKQLELYFVTAWIRGCSHITSAKNRGSYTPPPPSVSNGQHLADPPSPLRQQWSAFSLPPLPPSSAFVSIFPPALLYYNFRRRPFDMIKWGILIC